MKKLLVIVIALAAVWIGARYFLHRGEVRATIVVRDAATLHKGDPVVENGVAVGRITKIAHLDGNDALSVRLDREHRRAIVSDSLFAVDGRQLVVSNAFAVGAPIDDGAVLQARQGRVAQWLARHGDTVAPLLDRMKRATDEKLDDLDAEHIDATKARILAKVDALRKENRTEEANALKAKLDRWIHEVRR